MPASESYARRSGYSSAVARVESVEFVCLNIHLRFITAVAAPHGWACVHRRHLVLCQRQHRYVPCCHAPAPHAMPCSIGYRPMMCSCDEGGSSVAAMPMRGNSTWSCRGWCCVLCCLLGSAHPPRHMARVCARRRNLPFFRCVERSFQVRPNPRRCMPSSRTLIAQRHRLAVPFLLFICRHYFAATQISSTVRLVSLTCRRICRTCTRMPPGAQLRNTTFEVMRRLNVNRALE
jgi:hypothetical protein